MIDKAVTRELNDLLLRKYPALETDAAYRRLFLSLTLLHHPDTETGHPVVDRALVALCEGAWHRHAVSHRYVAAEFLERFARDTGIALNLTPHDSRTGAARTARLTLDPEVAEALAAELFALQADKSVWFVDQQRYTERSRTERLTAENSALERLVAATPLRPGQEAMFLYLNGTPSHPFKKYTARVDGAKKTVKAWDAGPRRDGAILALNALEENVRKPYFPRERTHRLFPQGFSLLSLPRELRRFILEGTLELDLTSAQARICAHTWPVPELAAFLESGVNLWHRLLDAARVEPDDADYPAYKKMLKEALYATFFGGGERMVTTILEGEDEKGGGAGAVRLTPEQVAAFKGDRLVRAILSGRENALRALRADGYGTSAFGERLPLESRTVLVNRDGEEVGEREAARYARGKLHFEGRDNSRSVLAAIAQSYEVAVINAVYEEATAARHWRVVLGEHDGVSAELPSSHSERSNRLIDRLSTAVERRGEELGIPGFGLECKLDRGSK